VFEVYRFPPQRSVLRVDQVGNLDEAALKTPIGTMPDAELVEMEAATLPGLRMGQALG
jgi:mRNA-degrading endonuclease toxin of MazEF toxin-antitoxin module